MTDAGVIKLDPPQSRKWVKFNEDDEEPKQPAPVSRMVDRWSPDIESRGELATTNGLNMIPRIRRHSFSDPVLSSSLSSEGSLGSAGEGSTSRPVNGFKPSSSLSQSTMCLSSSPHSSDLSTVYTEEDKIGSFNSMDDQTSPSDTDSHARDLIFNASFGGYGLNGSPTLLRTMWEPPKRHGHTHAGPWGTSLCSVVSERSISPKDNLSFSDIATKDSVSGTDKRFRKLSQKDRRPTLQVDSDNDEEARYTPFKELQKSENAYTGWSNQVLGSGPFDWSENIKSSRPTTLNYLTVSSPLAHQDILVETQTTPEMTGLRTISWPHSPTRTFVRNFP